MSSLPRHPDVIRAGILVAATTDLSNQDQVKARALADRNERLAYLAKQKGCTP